MGQWEDESSSECMLESLEADVVMLESLEVDVVMDVDVEEHEDKSDVDVDLDLGGEDKVDDGVDSK
jgi:hypothetical protein